MAKLIHKILAGEDHTCPWWLCFTFDNPLRRLVQNPDKILKDLVKPGDKALDIGPGMGYFTFPLSRMVGEKGRVIALDIQEEMLKRLEKKVELNKVENIKIKLYDGNKFALKEKFNFILLFWMYHEVSNKSVFIKEIVSVMEKGAKLLIVEPKMHVHRKKFDDSIQILIQAGFSIIDQPRISLSRSVLMQKK